MTITLIPWVMGLVLVVFLALIFLLNKIMYQPLLKFMDARDAQIKKDSAGADANTAEIKALGIEAEETLQRARAEATAIKNKARDAAQESAAKLLAAKRDELAKKREEFISQLQAERDGLKAALVADLPAFEKKLADKLANL